MLLMKILCQMQIAAHPLIFGRFKNNAYHCLEMPHQQDGAAFALTK
jgi:hypothetical protein